MKSKISIIILLLCVIVYPQNDYKILSSDQNSIIIEYTPGYSDTSLVTIDNRRFRSIVLDFGVYPEPDSWGHPAIPERRMSLGVPVEFGNTIEVLSTQFTEIDGQIAPIPKMFREGNLPVNKYTVGKGYFSYEDNPQLVLFGDFGITRGLKNQIIRILPVKYNVQSKKIKLYKQIVFRVQYGKGGNVVANQRYDELLSSAIINYDVARRWQMVKRKTINKINTSSVLATGKWVKFEATQEGIYKIDYDFLSSAGFDLNSIDPRTIKIYNNGGKVLSENINDQRPIDLVENAITIVGESDGKFDQGDYILFYGRGTDFWDYDSTQSKIVRFHHPYTNHNYYWITYGGVNGRRIQNIPSLNTTSDYLQTNSLAFADLEEDKINIGKTGREYYGDNFTQAILSRTYTNSLNGRISSTPINYNMRFAVASKTGLTLKASENNKPIFTRSLNGFAGHEYRVGQVYDNLKAVYQGDLPENRSVLKLSIEPFEINSVGYLDYFEISYTKDLEAFDNRILFFSKDTTAVIEYYLHNFPSSDISVYDVKDPANVKLITNCDISGGDCRFKMSEFKGSVTKYIGVGNKNYLTSANPVSVDNSDLRGIQIGAKYIIISPKDFLEAANRLKEFRENQATVPISTIVVQVDQIFDEFSCGMLDVSAIRDFIKYAYDNWQVTPEYVLFFGKGTYDYKNTEGYNDNFVPNWQTKESLIYIYGGDSYTTDDYFINVDDTEGHKGYIDLVSGRVTAANLTQANDYVSKVIDYELNSENGVWKNTMTLIADDALTTEGSEPNLHTPQMEYIANYTIPKSFNLNKIYLADYPTVLTSEGRRKPQVNVAIIDAINNGTVLVDFIGHGNPEVWTHEIVFEKSVSIPQLHNKDYFFLVAATCDFAYYDRPNEDSGTDELILKPAAGAIAGLSSVRVVESTSNYALNKAYMNSLLNSARDTLNLTKTIGSAYFTTKAILGYNKINDQKFHLFGDPVLRLQVPRFEGTIDSVDGQTLMTDVQLKALSNTHISGTILTPEGKKNENFNGEGILTVFDSERIKRLEQLGGYNVIIPGGIIFRSGVSVANGEFTASFVVPKDISYENKNGKIIFYYYDNSSDGIAFTNRITVGGTDTSVVNDGTGPSIDIFFDNSSSYNTYLVGPRPNLIVKLSDETGLNTTGTGVGHKLEGIMNENESAPIDFTNYFTGDIDASGKSGEINYKFDQLNEGDYSLLVKAWDVFNNYSNETTYFSVVTDDKLVVRDVYNYPNPFRSNTTFTFQHNLNEPVNVRIKIYTIAGRMIKEIESNDITDRFVKINWDGRDDDGDMIANGTYLYKIIVKSQGGEFNQSVLGKMAIIR